MNERNTAGAPASGARATTAPAAARTESYGGTERGGSPVKRISWGAIIAGVFALLAVHVLLGLLGLGTGLATVDVGGGGTPAASGLGTGAAVWYAITAVLAAIAGGWVAGRLAGMPNRTDGMLNGLITWAVGTLVIVYLLSSTLGGIAGGALGAVGGAVQTLASSGQSLASGALQVMPESVRGQAEDLFNRGAQQGQQQAQQTGQQAQQATGTGSTADAVQKVARGVRQGASPQDRQAAVNVIAQQAGIPPDQAEQRLSQFQGTYNDAVQQAQTQARQATDTAAKAVSGAAFGAFIAMLIAAIAAAFGGALGGRSVVRPGGRYAS